MFRKGSILAGAVLIVALAGCYHATITTGLPESLQKVERRWAAAWIYGLVPPSTVEATQRCTNGVARVETQLSFVNQLVGFLTWYIYTPMEIVVTCAAPRATNGPSVEATGDVREAVTRAAKLSVALKQPVDVRF